MHTENRDQIPILFIFLFSIFTGFYQTQNIYINLNINNWEVSLKVDSNAGLDWTLDILLHLSPAL